MPHLVHAPIEKSPAIQSTEDEVYRQIWMRLTAIRHTNLQTPQVRNYTAPLVTQARLYFDDASRCHWRSAGVLFYYSFLNLAKVSVIENRLRTLKSLKRQPLYHGLRDRQQSIKTLPEYEVEIHTTHAQTQSNVFALFYEAIIGKKWPFSRKITVSLRDVLPYIEDISAETKSVFGISSSLVQLMSLVRDNGKQIWYEILCPSDSAASVSAQVGRFFKERLVLEDLSKSDKSVWEQSHAIQAISFANATLLRSKRRSYENNQNNDAVVDTIEEAIQAFKGTAYFTARARDYQQKSWMFSPTVSLSGKILDWHPILSDYIASFAFGSILRYQPHLLPEDSPEAFIVESWCSQSPFGALRYFLMNLTNPSLILQSV